MEKTDFVSFPRAIPILLKSRLEVIFVWPWLTAIICLLVGRGFPPIRPTFLALLAMIFIVASVYLYNDINDKDMDRLNPVKKNRPIAANIVREKDAMKLIYLFAFIGLTFSLLINIYAFIFSFVFLFLFSIYSYPKVRLKKKFLANDLTIFFGCILSSLIGSYSILGKLSFSALFAGLLFGIFFTFVIKPIFKDTPDKDEDMLYGVRTLGNVLSWKRKIQLLILSILFIMTITPLTYIQLGFNVIVPIFVVAMNLIFLRLITPILHGFEPIKVKKIYKYAYIWFFSLQIVLIVGSLNLKFF